MPVFILWCLSRESNSSLANLSWLSFFWSFLKNDFSLTLIAWTEACITFFIHIVVDVVSQSHGDFVNLLVEIIVMNERKVWIQTYIIIFTRLNWSLILMINGNNFNHNSHLDCILWVIAVSYNGLNPLKEVIIQAK